LIYWQINFDCVSIAFAFTPLSFPTVSERYFQSPSRQARSSNLALPTNELVSKLPPDPPRGCRENIVKIIEMERGCCQLLVRNPPTR